MSANGHEAKVPELPSCDFCKDVGEDTPAKFDGRTPYGWAYMCAAHFTKHGPGKTGLGLAQRLVVDSVPEPDPDCVAAG